MNSLTSFFDMGGYGVFVWPSYLISAVVLAVLLGFSLAFRKRTEARLEQMREDKESHS